MWIRTEPGELVNLDHAHYIHIVECGAPKFHIEVVAHVGSERFVLAFLPTGNEGRNLALDYITTVSGSLQRAGKIVPAPMYPRHGDSCALPKRTP